mgnify:CR=1 FL=1
MLNPSLKLNEKMFDDPLAGGEQIPIRQGFGEGLEAAAKLDSRIVGLCADLTESTKMDLFAKAFPGRFIELGVAEQNLASVASGLAAMGKIPFISSYAMFSPGRNWEQIRTTICYNDRPVIIAGSHAGISVGPDGGTHQAIEDIAITRVIPRMTVISPCDALEARRATEAAAKAGQPIYLRLAREKTPVITTDKTPFKIGRAEIYFIADKPEVGIIATGALLHNALLAANELKGKGIEVEVMNLSTIKPLDTKAILEFAKRCEKIITIEEHQKAGGMGSAVAEFLSENHPVPMKIMGIDDQFGESGTPEELIKKFKLDKDSVIEAIRGIL